MVGGWLSVVGGWWRVGGVLGGLVVVAVDGGDGVTCGPVAMIGCDGGDLCWLGGWMIGCDGGGGGGGICLTSQVFAPHQSMSKWQPPMEKINAHRRPVMCLLQTPDQHRN